MLKRVQAIPPTVALGSILTLAVLLRAIFFVGLVSGDPQDDGIYYGNAFALYDRGPQYLGQYRNLPADFIANPIDQFHVRPLVTYPIAASFALFGPGEVSATLWASLCSALTILVVYRLGFLVHGPAVGLIAAFLCAFYPLEVVNGTRILSDVPVGLFTSASILLFIEGVQRQKATFYTWSGAAAAGAYLANARGLIVLMVLVGATVLMAGLRRASRSAPVWLVAGFLFVFSVEALIYYSSTGDPLLSYHIQSGASRFKYLHEPVSSLSWGWLQVDFTNGRPLELTRNVFLLEQGPTHQFGYFFFLFAASVLFSLFRRQHVLLLCLAIGLYLYLEFGPVRLSLDRSSGTMHYMMVFKQQRFLLMLTAPLVVLAASFVWAVGKASRIAAVLLLTGLFATSIAAIAETRRYYRSGLSDLRTITATVRSHPETTFFGDLWAVEHVKIFSGYQAGNLKVLNDQTRPEEVRNACVMLGGSRGVDLLGDYVESTLPAFARDVLDRGAAPGRWTLVEEIDGQHTPQRLRNLTVYCVQ